MADVMTMMVTVMVVMSVDNDRGDGDDGGGDYGSLVHCSYSHRKSQNFGGDAQRH